MRKITSSKKWEIFWLASWFSLKRLRELILPLIPLIFRLKFKRTTPRFLLKIDLAKPRNLKATRNLVLVYHGSFFQTISKRNQILLRLPEFFLSDTLSKLPNFEEDRATSIVDSKVIIPWLELAKDKFTLKAKSYITRNLRREKTLKVSPNR